MYLERRTTHVIEYFYIVLLVILLKYMISVLTYLPLWRCVTLSFYSVFNNMKNANQGSLRDKTVREQLPDRRLLAGMCALFVSW